MNDLISWGLGMTGLVLIVHTLLYMMFRSSGTARRFATEYYPFSHVHYADMYDSHGNTLRGYRQDAKKETAIVAGLSILYSPILVVVLTALMLWKMLKLSGKAALTAVKLPARVVVEGQDGMGRALNKIAQLMRDALEFAKEVYSQLRKKKDY